MEIKQTSESLLLDSSHPTQATMGNGCGCLGAYFAVPLLAFGVGLLLSPSWAVLQCKRLPPAQPACKFTSSTLLLQKTTMSVQLRGAEVEVSYDSETGDSYRPILITQDGKLPFTNVYSSDELEAKHLASQINDFLQNPAQQVLEVKEDDQWFVYLFGSILILVGIGMGLFGAALNQALRTKYLWLFDKNSGKFQVIEQVPSGKTRVTQEWTLHQISRVQMIETKGLKGDCFYTVQLGMRSGEKVQLPSGSTASKDYEVAAGIIRDFLA